MQSRGFAGIFIETLLKSVLTLMKNVDEAIHKGIHGSAITTLTISNEEMGDIIKIVKESSLLIKVKGIENKAK